MTQAQPPALLSFDGARIPEALKAMPRWAPWKAIWSEKKQKYDKVPYRVDAPEYGLSTARPDKWFTFEAAMACLKRHKGFAGLGFCMTGVKGIVGVDLDHCLQDGQLSPLASHIVNDLHSYTELSPSGNGLRIFVLGGIEEDWNNHDVGIEVYGGNQARFLTVTGQALHDTPADIVIPKDTNRLTRLKEDYAREKVKATVEDLEIPDILDELSLPDITSLTLPEHVEQFLTDGTHDGDGSAALFGCGIALYANGLSDQEVYSLLANNEHAMQTALAHRRDDNDKALMFLWKHDVLAAKARGKSRLVSIDDFEDLTPRDAEGKPVPSKNRYVFEDAAKFASAKPIGWLIKKVLPAGEIGVLYGASGVGKSFFTLDMVLAIANGEPWRGNRVKQGTVAYICAEGAGGFRLRLKAYSDHHGVSLDGLPLKILGNAPNFMEARDIKDLLTAIQVIGPVSLIVVDTWAQVTAGANENSGEDMGKALAHCKRLHELTGAMVLLVAHSGKDEDRGMRGWSGVKGALDVQICVTRADHYREAKVVKVKDGEGEDAVYPFSLETVVLGQDEDGDNITSCVIRDNNSATKPEPKLNGSATQQLVLKIARELIEDYAGGPLTVNALVDSAVSQMPHDETKRDRRRDNALRAVTALTVGGHISTQDGLVSVR